jgi:radical SAM superfamily enzyme YgiQ (UPF0313 family)
VVTDENFIGYTERDIEDRKILLEKMIRRRYKFVWGCQASTKLAAETELMSLMYRAGCRAVFVGFESIDEEGLKLVGKNHNIGLDYRQVIARLHDHKLAVVASTILGLDSHDRAYPDRLIAALKRSKADFPRVFFATAWPGTPLFAALEKEGRANHNWDEVRKDVPSIQFKNFTHAEAIAARKKILDAFFNVFTMSRTLSPRARGCTRRSRARTVRSLARVQEDQLHPVDEPAVFPRREPLESEKRPEHVAGRPLSAFACSWIRTPAWREKPSRKALRRGRSRGMCGKG